MPRVSSERTARRLSTKKKQPTKKKDAATRLIRAYRARVGGGGGSFPAPPLPAVPASTRYSVYLLYHAILVQKYKYCARRRRRALYYTYNSRRKLLTYNSRRKLLKSTSAACRNRMSSFCTSKASKVSVLAAKEHLHCLP